MRGGVLVAAAWAAPLAVVLAAVLAVPTVLASRAAGFPALAPAWFVDTLDWCLAGALVTAVGYGAIRPLGRLWRPRIGALLAMGVAALPAVALAGYHLNRSLGVRPRQLLEPPVLGKNLLLLLVAAGLVVALAWLVERDLTAGWRRAAILGSLGVLALAHAATAWLYAPGPRRDRPDVLLVVVDALRADHLGAYGYPRPTTPALDALASDSLLFRQAVSQSTFTKTSIASLLTGRYAYQHGVYWGSLRTASGVLTADVLPEEETTLAERLRQLGYLTAAWVQNSHLVAAMGFGQGFVLYHDQQGPLTRIHRRFFRFLRGPARRYPFFAYLHYIDLHDPYRPRPPYDTMFGVSPDPYEGIDLDEWGAYLEAMRRGDVTVTEGQLVALRDLYDAQLRWIDDGIGRLVARLRDEGLYDSTLLVLTSDHGEAFLEHGALSHSTTPYDELVRVPLLIKLPGNRLGGSEVTAQVRHVDVLPTILELLGSEVGPEVVGCGLLPLGRDGGRDRAECSVAVIEIAEDEESSPPTVAVRTGEWKYIRRGTGAVELYDLTTDAAERHNLADAAPAPEVVEVLAAWVERADAARRSGEGEAVELDEQQIRELKALGYVH